jgi:hypothetical protein
MEDRFVKAWFTSPNFTTAPPPDSPIDLGSILLRLDTYEAINRGQVIEIPDNLRFKPDRKNYSGNADIKTKSHRGGIFGDALAAIGMHFHLSAGRTKGSSSVLYAEEIKTIGFEPDQKYIEASMAVARVTFFYDRTKWKEPVYMIVGIKIAHRAAYSSGNAQLHDAVAKVGASVPGSPMVLGPEYKGSWGEAMGQWFGNSTDFVLAIRVRKIMLAPDDVIHDHGEYREGANMKSGGSRRPALKVRDLGEVFNAKDLNLPFDFTTLVGTAGDGGGERETLVIPTKYLSHGLIG